MMGTLRSEKITIVYVIDGLGMGGAERLMVPILKHLDSEVFEPRVCVLKNKGGNPIEKDLLALGVTVDKVPVPYLRDLTAIPRLHSYLKKVNASLVHTQLEFATILGGIAAKLAGLPSVCTIHTMPSDDIGQRMKMHQRLEMLSLRYFCDKVISVSEEAGTHHLKIGYSRPEQIQTIYNGIDLSNYAGLNKPECKKSVHAEFSLPSDAQILTTVAVLRELKGIQYMIEALPAVLAQNPNAYYLIVGSGSHQTSLENAVNALGIKDRVIFSGRRSDIPRLLAASDIFVLPTLTEALPTVLAEAMASRLPIIASRVGGIPEMVDHENAILLQPQDVQALIEACNLLLSNPEKRQQMGEVGWNIVNKKFNIVAQVEQLKNLYLELIKNGK